MKVYYYIILMVLLVGCVSPNTPSKPADILQADSVFLTADIQGYGDYYQSGHQVYSIDLLSDGLQFDSVGRMTGTGYNLYLSDVFASIADSLGIPAGKYEMDSVARTGSFLRGLEFDGSVTGCYLLEIQNDQLKRIVLFEAGSMQVGYEENDIVLDMTLYTEDSVAYRAKYTGEYQ